MNKKIIIVVSFLILAALVGGFWYFNTKKINLEILNNVKNNKNSNYGLEEKKGEINKNELVWYDIPELGIKFKINNSIKDELIYSYKGKNDGYGVILFSSKKLSKIPGCETEQGPLTSISKIEGVPANYPNVDYIIARNPKQFNGFFLLHDGPQAVCAENNYIDEWKKYFEKYPEFKNWEIQLFDTVEEMY